MNTSSRKNKGRRLQKLVAEAIRRVFPRLTERDVRTAPMGVTGEDIQLSEEGSRHFPFSVECKNQERAEIWKWMEQAESENRQMIPLVVFKRNRVDPYVSMKFEDFMKLVSLLNIHMDDPLGVELREIYGYGEQDE